MQDPGAFFFYSNRIYAFIMEAAQPNVHAKSFGMKLELSKGFFISP